MLTNQDDTIRHAADGLSWAIATQRWLRGELRDMGDGGTLVLDRDGVEALLAGAAGISEVLADYLRAPGVLTDSGPAAGSTVPGMAAPIPPTVASKAERLGLRVVTGGKGDREAAQ